MMKNKKKTTKQREIIAELHEKKVRNGQQYFSGYFIDGGAKITLLKQGKRLNNFGEPIWELYIELK